jgi:membrane-associated phospholipid phosphatase
MTANENASAELNLPDPDKENRAKTARAKRRRRRVHFANAVLLTVFFVLAFLAHAIPFFNWDLAITNYLQSIKFLHPLMVFVSFFGNGLTPHLITAFTVLIFLIFRLRYEALWLVFSAGVGAGINALLKRVIGRPRPTDDFISILQQPGGLSFPSGHVTFYVCYFGFLLFLVYRNIPRQSPIRIPLLILLMLPILLVGFSRVYLGAHWASDTLGAYLWSSVWLMLSFNLYQKMKERERVTSGE